MDVLDRVTEAGRDLLGRVDDALSAGGAPTDHTIWPLLRHMGALPGDIFEGFCALRPAPVQTAALDLHRRAEGYSDERAELDATAAAVHWSGDAGAEFGARWQALGGYLGAQPVPSEESMAGRLAATASYADEVARWMGDARTAMAHTVAEALGSMEAVRLRTGGAAGAEVAAATIGALVLETARAQFDAVESVADRWAPLLGDLQFRPGAEPVGRTGAETRVSL
jgi:hypothetical protein